MGFGEVIKPAETVVQAGNVVVLSSGRNCLMHGYNRLRKAAKVGM